jgi:hypothetical protein
MRAAALDARIDCVARASFLPTHRTEQEPLFLSGEAGVSSGLLACMAGCLRWAGWLQEQYTGAGVIRSRLTLMPGSWAGS